MLRIVIALALFAFMPAGVSEAAIGDVYRCQAEKYFTVGQDGGLQNRESEYFQFTWQQNRAVLSGPQFITQFESKYEIQFQDGTFVSAGGTTWGTMQFNEKTNVLVVFAPRLDSGTIAWARCRRV